MRVLSVNSHASSGGAGRAMYRLHKSLKAMGQTSQILARSRSAEEADVFVFDNALAGRGSSLARMIDALGSRLELRLGIPFSQYQSTRFVLASDLVQQADVIQLHNLHGRYFNLHVLPRLCSQKPVVWTLHDMWALTGHCAYSYGCQRWKTGCFDCPLLKEPDRRIVEPSPTRLDVTRRVWRTKRRLYRKSELHIVTPSQWLCSLVKASILADAASVECIPNGLDLTVFRPRDRATARRALDVPADAKAILFVAEKVGHRRKGFHCLLDSLEAIEDTESIVLMTVGAGAPVASQLERFRCRHLGPLSDERLMGLVLGAADLFVFPTLADNQPLVVMEAMACGTPTVSFDVGGVPEMVRHMETGYLARYKDAQDMAQGIQLLLDDKVLRTRMGRRCRETAEAEYSVLLQAQRYLEAYEYALEHHANGS